MLSTCDTSQDGSTKWACGKAFCTIEVPKITKRGKKKEPDRHVCMFALCSPLRATTSSIVIRGAGIYWGADQRHWSAEAGTEALQIFWDTFEALAVNDLANLHINHTDTVLLHTIQKHQQH